MDVHYIEITAYAEKTRLEAVKASLKQILPENSCVSEEVLPPETEGGVFTKEIHSLKALLEKQDEVKEFVEKVKAGLSKKELEQVRSNIQDLVDEDCNLYIRLDKKAAENGGYKLVASGDCIHVRIKLAVYPAKHEAAVEKARRVFS